MIIIIFLEILISLLLYNILINKSILKNIVKNITLALLSCLLFKLLYIFLHFIFFKLLNYSALQFNHLIVEFSIITSILVIISFHYYKTSYRLVVQKKNLEINTYSNIVLEELIESIKVNEHEYKNHLNTLYSIIEVEDSKEEIKSKVRKYIGDIKDTSKIAGILNIKNTIIKAIIYNKILECNNFGINFSYKIKGDFKDNLEDWELNIVLTNLLNNAIDEVKKLENKDIEVVLDDNIIEVRNSIENLEIKEIEGFFKKGFSKKGQNRGYGLFNVMKIIKKNKGEINITLEDNYLIIKIIF